MFRSSQHTYAQVICDKTGVTLASASTLEKTVKSLLAQQSNGSTEKGGSLSGDNSPGSGRISTKSVLAAKTVGNILGQRCQEKNIDKVVFDRNGFQYAGRIKALADGAREAGLKF